MDQTLTAFASLPIGLILFAWVGANIWRLVSSYRQKSEYADSKLATMLGENTDLRERLAEERSARAVLETKVAFLVQEICDLKLEVEQLKIDYHQDNNPD